MMPEHLTANASAASANPAPNAIGAFKRMNAASTSAKDLYRRLTAKEPSIPIFSRDWWLDATAGDENWDVALVRNGNQVLAAMPYAMRRRYGMKALGQPALTQTLGPWLFPMDPGTSEAKKLAQEKDLMHALIDQLPGFDYFNQNWHYTYTNWLPFSWRGFTQTTHYTYVLTDLRDPDRLWAGFQGNVRRNCKAAMERHRITVRAWRCRPAQAANVG